MTEADTLRLGCGADTRPNQYNVDKLDLAGVDETTDLEDMPWPWPDESWSLIIAEHVFEHLDDIEGALRECARLLEPGGRLRVVMPMGNNAVADPDHEHVWTWQTPECYCGARHWDVDVGLSVVSKTVDLHTHHRAPLYKLVSRALWEYQLQRYGPGEWCFSLPAMSGEFTVLFQK